jgi:hypothetical protein
MNGSRAWPAVILLGGVALATGYAVGRRADRPATSAPDMVTADSGDSGDSARPHAGRPLPIAGPPSEHHRLRPDVLLGPVLLVMIGIIVDRLRESDAGESVTAWLLIAGAITTALLARSAGYRSAARGFYCFLLVFSWAAASLYVQSGLGALPQSWVSSTLAASLLWLAVDLRQSLRHAPPGRRGRAVLAACEQWLGFFVAWAVLAQLIYLYVSRTLADPGQHRVLAWLSVLLVTVLGSAAIVAMTITWPRRRATAGTLTDHPESLVPAVARLGRDDQETLGGHQRPWGDSERGSPATTAEPPRR